MRENNSQRRLSQPRDSRERPPNYFARSTQLRLLTATASLMLVLVLMAEARKPANWAWMWAGTTGQAGVELAQVDTRVPARAADPPGMVRMAPVVPPSAAGDVDRVLTDAWAFVLGRLKSDERRRIEAALWAARRPQGSHRELIAQLRDVLPHVDSAWQHYFDQAVRTPPSESRASLDAGTWRSVVGEARFVWSREWRPALGVIADQEAWQPEQAMALRSLQEIDDRVSLLSVRDDTVSRYEERYIWFRLFEQLQQTSQRELHRRSSGLIGFLQLFRQPNVYRGKVVTIRGAIRLAYRVSAPENLLGIDHYYVFWLKPAGGQLSPFIVYALELPDGFPALGDRQSPANAAAEAIELEVTGIFFKRRAYRALDGVNTAPVVLAKVPTWSPARSARPVAVPRTAVTVVSMVLVGLLAIVVARLAVGSRDRRWRSQVDERQAAEDIAALSDWELSPPVGDRLQALSQPARQLPDPKPNDHETGPGTRSAAGKGE